MDDSSRLIACHGVFVSPTTDIIISILNQGFREYGTPREILTDNGTQFVSARDREHTHPKFGEFLFFIISDISRQRLNTPDEWEN